ncbi:hypothetical protein U9M48_039994 [Paspalum notatum var. saurae]|uniref:Integrase catalytic domain-containing protein n=1 Tax=Paspalum notatum var. saurae TaxID=547442 RepID=A0AAQ3UQ12_PASNO
MAHFIPLLDPYIAQGVAKHFMDSIVRLHGFPQSIVSDHDPIFISAFWCELFKQYKVSLNLSTTYHPQSDGQTERINQCLEMYLRCAVHESPHQWKSWLSLVELWYNTTFHTTLDTTGLSKCLNAWGRWHTSWIFLPTIKFILFSMFRNSSLTHQTLHRSSILFLLSLLWKLGAQPVVIIDRHLLKKGNAAITQVMVTWCGLPSLVATWEDYQVLKTRFPDAVAWGQAPSLVGGVITTTD